MHTICFYGSFSGRGTEKATVDLANMLSGNYAIYVLNTADKKLTYKLNDNVEYVILGTDNVYNQIKKLIKFIRCHRIEVLISVEALSGITAIPACIITRTKSIIWDHGNFYQNKGSKYMSIARKLELLFCDTYVVLTNRDLRLYRQHYKHIKTRLLRIYNSVQFEVNNLEYNNCAKTILSVGHIDRNKNFIIIPELASKLFSKHPDWKWELYGDGEDNDIIELKATIRRYHMEDNVIMHGFVSDIKSAYQNASFYVMTSYFEGFPLVLIEAKANKLPIISFDIDTGPDEIIRNGVNGFLVPRSNMNEMENRIRMLMEDSLLRKQFSDNSDLDLDILSRDNIGEQWISEIDRCIKE